MLGGKSQPKRGARSVAQLTQCLPKKMTKKIQEDLDLILSKHKPGRAGTHP